MRRLPPSPQELTDAVCGELPPGRHAEVERALREHPSLRDDCEEIRALAESLTFAFATAPEPELTDAQRAEALAGPPQVVPPLTAERSAPPKIVPLAAPRRRPAGWAVAAVVAGLLAAGLVFWSGREEAGNLANSAARPVPPRTPDGVAVTIAQHGLPRSRPAQSPGVHAAPPATLVDEPAAVAWPPAENPVATLLAENERHAAVAPAPEVVVPAVAVPMPRTVWVPEAARPLIEVEGRPVALTGPGGPSWSALGASRAVPALSFSPGQFPGLALTQAAGGDSVQAVRTWWREHRAPPPANLVRLEEFVQAFAHLDDAPGSGRAAAELEVAPCPWASHRRLLRVTLRPPTLPVDAIAPRQITLVLHYEDTPEAARAQLLFWQSLPGLAAALGPEDEVAIVSTGTVGGVLLPPTKAPSLERLRLAAESLDHPAAPHLSAAELGRLLPQWWALRPASTPHLVLVSSQPLAPNWRDAGRAIRLTRIGLGAEPRAASWADGREENLGRRWVANSGPEARFQAANRWFAPVVAKPLQARVQFHPGLVESWQAVGPAPALTPEHTFTGSTAAKKIELTEPGTWLFELTLADPARLSRATRPGKFAREADRRMGLDPWADEALAALWINPADGSVPPRRFAAANSGRRLPSADFRRLLWAVVTARNWLNPSGPKAAVAAPPADGWGVLAEWQALLEAGEQ